MIDGAGAAAPTDAERMRAALELASGHPSPAARAMAAARRSGGPRWTVVTLVIAAVVLLIGDGAARSEPDVASVVPVWRETISGGLFVAAGLAAAVLVVAFLRSGAIGRFRSSPVRVLTEHQRDQLRLQIDGEEAVDRNQLPLTRGLVTDSLRTVPNVWWWLPVIAVFIAGALRAEGQLRWLVTALVIAVSVTALVRHRARVRHLRTFLELHTVTTTPEGNK